jgi:YidC/Oxa1 family membrane protein insertase
MFGFLAHLLSWCYQVWPNFAGMIVLFTLIIMAVVTPFTVKGMRSAAEMARIQPEMKKLQDQHKNDKVKQNEEMQALFKEHGVNPLGGCLPTLLPLPIFFIIFRLLERMNARHSGTFAPLVRLVRHNVGGPVGFVDPHYLAFKDTLTQAIIHSNGQLKVLGMDLALTARDHHNTVGAALPFYGLIVIMTGSQYWQQRQINQRNPAAANANPQMKMTMQLFPAFYALISLNIPAAVVFYLLISGLFRMAQNSISYRFDPVLARAAVPVGGTIEAASRPKGQVGKGAPQKVGAGQKAALTSGNKGSGSQNRQKANGGARTSPKAAADATPPKQPGGFMDKLRAQAAEAKSQAEKASAAKADKRTQGNGGAPAESPAGNGKNGVPKPADEPAAPIEVASEVVDSDVIEADTVGSDGAPLIDPARSNRAGSPLSIRPSGRRRKDD